MPPREGVGGGERPGVLGDRAEEGPGREGRRPPSHVSAPLRSARDHVHHPHVHLCGVHSGTEVACPLEACGSRDVRAPPCHEATPGPRGQMSLAVPLGLGRGGGCRRERLGRTRAHASGPGPRSVADEAPCGLRWLQASAFVGWGLLGGHRPSPPPRWVTLVVSGREAVSPPWVPRGGSWPAPHACSASSRVTGDVGNPGHLLFLSVVLCTVTVGTPGPASAGTRSQKKNRTERGC